MRVVSIISVAVLSIFAATSAYAQNVANVDANQEGKSIAITYDLKEKSNISVFITYDGGRTITELPSEFLSGSVGKRINPGKDNKIVWKVLDQYPQKNFQGEHLSFVVKGKVCWRTYAMLIGGYSFDSGPTAGFSVGQLGRIGWYVKALTTLAVPQNCKYSCDEYGDVDEVFPAYSGLASKSKIYGVGGLVVRLGVPVYLNAGIGYGRCRVDWQTLDGQWVHNVPLSYCGRTIDIGLMASLNHLCLSAGVDIVCGQVDANLGIGCVF
ncbi:MAG: hypothetical protein KBS55_00995 [Bacteroidales bacterium]|nr:hypothetical protein [Candidatus Cryptobacteroides aphodequi]